MPRDPFFWFAIGALAMLASQVIGVVMARLIFRINRL